VDETLVPADAVDAPASTVRGLLDALDGEGLRELAARAETAEERVPLAEATLCAPIPDAHKIICLGLNYRDHAEENGPGDTGRSEVVRQVRQFAPPSG